MENECAHYAYNHNHNHIRPLGNIFRHFNGILDRIECKFGINVGACGQYRMIYVCRVRSIVCGAYAEYGGAVQSFA